MISYITSYAKHRVHVAKCIRPFASFNTKNLSYLCINLAIICAIGTHGLKKDQVLSCSPFHHSSRGQVGIPWPLKMQGKHTAFKDSSIHYSKHKEKYHFLGFFLFVSSKCFICAFTANMLPSPSSSFLFKKAFGSRRNFAFNRSIAKILVFSWCRSHKFCQLEGSASVLYSIWNHNKQNCLTHTDKFLLCLPKRFQLKFNNKSLCALEFYCH